MSEEEGDRSGSIPSSSATTRIGTRDLTSIDLPRIRTPCTTTLWAPPLRRPGPVAPPPLLLRQLCLRLRMVVKIMNPLRRAAVGLRFSGELPAETRTFPRARARNGRINRSQAPIISITESKKNKTKKKRHFQKRDVLTSR